MPGRALPLPMSGPRRSREMPLVGAGGDSRLGLRCFMADFRSDMLSATCHLEATCWFSSIGSLLRDLCRPRHHERGDRRLRRWDERSEGLRRRLPDAPFGRARVILDLFKCVELPFYKNFVTLRAFV